MPITLKGSAGHYTEEFELLGSKFKLAELEDDAYLAFLQAQKGLMEYVREHSQEMDAAVCRAHIDLYVNEFTLDYGEEGEAAIEQLLNAAACVGVVPGSCKGLFWDD